MKYNLYLDDFRDPRDSGYYLNNPIYETLEWVVVRNYDEFVKCVEENGVPEVISFDHDLGGDMEIWDDVVGYEGVYRVSTLGRVMRIKRRKGAQINKILKPIKNESGLLVTLRNCGNDIRTTIHRLVGVAFIENSQNKPEINHKDGNRWNNNINNLEWVTSSENNRHAHNELNREYTAFGENHNNSLSVSQYDKNDVLINVFGSVNEAGRQLKICFSNIAKCARGERKYAGGFMWRYENKTPTICSNIKHINKDNKYYSKRFFIPPTFTEKTGYDCAKWFINYIIDIKLDLPKTILIHSMNPVGSANIKSLFDSYIKSLKI